MARHHVVICLLVASSIAHASMVLTSPEFDNQAFIPGDYGCDILSGVDRDLEKPSPPLFWTRAPAHTQSFILLVDDVDDNEAVHWLVTDIPRNVSQLEAGASGVNMPEGAQEMVNAYGFTGYAGPCPSNQTHAIRFRVFAMGTPSTSLNLPHRNATQPNATLTASDITSQIEDSNLYCAVLVGVYFSPEACPVAVPANVPCPCPGPDCPLRAPLVCPVFVLPGEACPCPGPLCPPPNTTRIRYVKPSESLKAHPLLPPNNPEPRGTLDDVDCEDVAAHAKDRAQTVSVHRLLPPALPFRAAPPSARAAAIVEDIPMPEEEMKRRHIRHGGLQRVEDLTLLQTQEAGDVDDSPLVPSEMQDLHQAQASVTTTVTDDIAVLSPPDNANDKAVSECSVSMKRGCKRRTVVVPRFGLTLWSSGLSTANDSSVMSSNYTCAWNISEPRDSLPVSWAHIPHGTQSLILMLDDATSRVYSNPENPTEIVGGPERVLWLVTNIPVSAKSLPRGASASRDLPVGAVELVKYTPPCQDAGDHSGLVLPRVFRLALYAMPVDSSYVHLPDRGAATSPFINVQLHPIYTAVTEVKLEEF